MTDLGKLARWLEAKGAAPQGKRYTLQDLLGSAVFLEARRELPPEEPPREKREPVRLPDPPLRFEKQKAVGEWQGDHKEARGRWAFMRRPHNARERECMACKVTFRSEGNHNRMCHLCREKPTPVEAAATPAAMVGGYREFFEWNGPDWREIEYVRRAR